MIELRKINKSYGAKEIFKDLNIIVPKQTKAGIIGPNGSGKTTLFKLISNQELVDSGEIIFHIKNPRLGYMYQEISTEENMSVIDFLKKEIGLLELELKMQDLENDLSDKEKLLEYGDILEEYENLNGYNFEFEIEIILEGLGLKSSINRNILTLSSGQKSKVLLALALYKGKDILLLDEPTNNLDSTAIKWLTDFVIDSKATILLISHDRDFLDNVTNFTYEIDVKNNKIIEYKGNYSHYKKYKEEKFQREVMEYEENQAKIYSLKEVIKEKDLISKSVVKSKPKDNNIMSRNGFIEQTTKKLGGQMKSIKSRIEKMDNLEKPVKDKKIRFTIENSKNFGNISVSSLNYRYSNSDFNLTVDKFEASKNDRISIEGDNGSGKSTFLKILNKQIEGFFGECRISSNIKIADYNTEHDNLPQEISPIKLIMKEGNLDEIEANKYLAIFNLEYRERYNEIRLLSPGQRAKLLLTLFKLKDFNTLILDEPTNHLDMEALEVLENVLTDFDGILIAVSHDKKFLENIGITKRYLMENGVLIEMY